MLVLGMSLNIIFFGMKSLGLMFDMNLDNNQVLLNVGVRFLKSIRCIFIKLFLFNFHISFHYDKLIIFSFVSFQGVFFVCVEINEKLLEKLKAIQRIKDWKMFKAILL